MARPFTCIVAESDESVLRHIESTMGRVEGLRCLAYCRSTQEAAAILEKECVDWMLLGRQMHESDGLPGLTGSCREPYVTHIVTQDSAPHAAALPSRVSRVAAPISLPALLRCYEVLLDYHAQGSSLDGADNQMIVKLDSGMRGLTLSRIQLVEAMADYVRIHCVDRRHTVYSSMKAIMDQLPLWRFARVHRSYIVNLAYVDRLDRRSIHLLGGQNIPIGITYRKPLLSLLEAD